jgi:ABC-2 type transport system ATP-binding protein
MPDDAGAPAIEVIDVVKEFGRRRVIDGLSFTVPRGQVCALLGPNGAGKTTTIHMLLGLTLPSSGTIRILGTDVVADRSAALARTNFTASYVSLPWRLKVRELLRIYSELYEVPDPDAAIAEVGELLGIDRFLDRLGQSLSTGQQTIVLLAKALVNRPELLFLDEPTASLDPERAVAVRTLLRRIADERGMTILITSHNMTEVERLADRILFVANGTVAADSTATELRERFGAEDLEEVYLKVAAGALDEPSAEMLVAGRGTAEVDLMGDDDHHVEERLP